MTDQLDVLALVTSRLDAGGIATRGSRSEMQRRDLRAVIATQTRRLDWASLESWAARLDLVAALQGARP